MKPSSVSAVRASISFPADLYERLEALAKHKKVSLAWVVRDAAEKYISDYAEYGPGIGAQENSAPKKDGRDGQQSEST